MTLAALLPRTFLPALLLLLAAALAPHAEASILLWDGNTATAGLQDGAGNWNTTDANRWYNNATLGYQVWSNTTPDSAVFGNASGAAGTVTLTAPISVSDITFNPASSGAYVITGNATNKLTFTSATTPVIQTALDAAAVASINAVIAGNQGFNKTGDGILALGGALANEYTGTTTVSAGTLRLEKTSGITAVQGDIVIAGGTLRWNNANQVADTASVTLNSGTLWIGGQPDIIRNLTLNGGTTNGGTGSNGGTFTINDTLSVTGSTNLGLNSGANWSANTVVFTGTGTALSMTGNSNTVISQFVVGPGGLSITGRTIGLNSGNTGNALAKGSKIVLNGDVTATGVNSITENGSNVGVTQVDQGSATRTWNVVKILAADVTNVGVAIVGTSTSGLIKTGDGTLLFSGEDANSYTGLTTISGGILQVGKTAGVTAIAGDIQINTGGKLAYTATTGEQIADTATITLNGGGINFANRSETFANLYQIAAGSSVNTDQSNGSVITITGTLRATAGGTINLNSGGRWTVHNTEFTSTFTGNAIALNGNSNTNMNRYTVGIDGSGGIILTGQTISLAKGTNNGGTPATTAKGSELVLDANLTASGTNNITVGGGTIGVTQVNLNGGQREFNITSGTTTSNAPIVSTTITVTGDDATPTVGGITKTGAGTLVLNAANTYTGATVVQAGTLRLGSAGSIDASPTVTVAAGATLNVASVTGGFSVKSGQTLQGGGTVTGATTINSGATLSIGTVSADLTQTLTIGGSLSLIAGSNSVFDLGTPTFTSTNGFGGNEVGTAGYTTYVQAYSTALTGDHDRLISTASINQALGATITVLGNDFTPASGQIFNLLDWQTSFSASANLGANFSASGYVWDISLFASDGIVVIVPEPSRALLLLTGLTLLGFRRRRCGR